MGCTTTQRTEQVLEAMDWYFGARECRSITFVNDTAGDQEDLYFDLNAIDENYAEKKYYVWLDAGTGTDPSVAGKTGIQVVYTSGDSASVIAGLAQVAIDAVVNFNAEVSAAVVEIENKFLGDIATEDYSNAGSISGAVNKAGFGGKLGAIASGGGSVNTSQELEDIKSDQTGEIILDQIIKGSSVSIDLSLNEMNTARWESLIGEGYGAKEGTSVGYGTSKLYKSSFDFAGMLIGTPVRLPLSDRSADIVLWKTTPNMNSIAFSGSEVQSAEFSFVGLKDSTKPSTVDLFARGDHSLL
jgi:hypothetical protein